MKEDVMGGAYSMGESRNVYTIFGRKPRGKSLLGRTSREWEDSNKMDLKEIGSEGVEWIHMAEDREDWWAFVNTAMNLRVP
jgi:hypothetical protein